jgi:riboflavin kinase, archaea type
MTTHADLYEAKTGVRLYPGSLNVELDDDWHVGIQRLRLEPPKYGIGLSIVPCTIRGVDAFILRTDNDDGGGGDHAPNVIEVAASVRLRDALGLKDGDEVEVIVKNETGI